VAWTEPCRTHYHVSLRSPSNTTPAPVGSEPREAESQRLLNRPNEVACRTAKKAWNLLQAHVPPDGRTAADMPATPQLIRQKESAASKQVLTPTRRKGTAYFFNRIPLDAPPFMQPCPPPSRSSFFRAKSAKSGRRFALPVNTGYLVRIGNGLYVATKLSE